MLSGYKTYIAAIGLVLIGLYQWMQGDVDAAFKSFTEALGFAGLRSAIAHT